MQSLFKQGGLWNQGFKAPSLALRPPKSYYKGVGRSEELLHGSGHQWVGFSLTGFHLSDLSGLKMDVCKEEKILPPHPPPVLLPSHWPVSRLQCDIWASLFQHLLSAGVEEFVQRGIPRLWFLADILCLICVWESFPLDDVGNLLWFTPWHSGSSSFWDALVLQQQLCRSAQVGWDDRDELSIFRMSQVPQYWSARDSNQLGKRNCNEYALCVGIFFAFYPFHPVTR